MRSALRNLKFAAIYSKYNTITLIYSDTPIPLQVTSQRFRFSDPAITIPLNILNQFIYPPESFFVLTLPI